MSDPRMIEPGGTNGRSPADSSDGHELSRADSTDTDGGVRPAAWQLDRNLVRLDALVAGTVALAAVVGAIWFTYHFAVNVIYADQWRDVYLIDKANLGQLTPSDLWAQYIEHRVVVPDLLLLTVGRWTHDNLVVTDLICAVLACVSAFSLLWSFRRWSPRLPWTALLPPLLLMLSAVPMGQALFGFNICWYLALAGFGLAVLAADGRNLRTSHLALAVASATVASLSSFPGLFVWIAVGAILALRGRSRKQQIGWWLAAAAVMTVFFIGYRPSGGGHASTGYVLHHPAAVFGYFLSELGVVTGIGEGHRLLVQYTWPLVAAGFTVLVLASVGVLGALRSGRDDGSPVAVAMVIVALLFAVTSTIGRVGQGIDHAFLFALFIVELWAGAYLLWIAMALRSTATSGHGPGFGSRIIGIGTAAVAILTVIVLLESTVDGIPYAQGYHRLELRWASLEANADRVSPELLDRNVASGRDPQFIAQMAEVALRWHLSVFGTEQAAGERQRAASATAAVAVVLPRAGVVSARSVLLNAAVHPAAQLVYFTILESDGRSVRIEARAWKYGWIAAWQPTTSGVGLIRATAVMDSGTSYTSAVVQVQVEPATITRG